MTEDFLHLSDDQQRAMSLMQSGASVFLTGGAGTGKSATIGEFVKRNPRRKIARLATTGAAAQLIGGQTLHSFFGLFPAIHMPHDTRVPEKIRQRLRGVDTIIIDEISQCRIDQFQAIRDRLFGAAKGYGPFAGFQMICVGDFAQLPPVMPEKEKAVIESVYGEQAQFAFQSRYWDGLQAVELSTLHRQVSDPEFAAWLNQLRHGEVPDLDVINARVGPARSDVVTLVATNRRAQDINEAEMRKIPGGCYRIEGQCHGDFQERDMRVPPTIALKPGSRVIICANDPDKAYANGSTGTLIACQRDQAKRPEARVRLDNGQEVLVRQHTWETVDYQTKMSPTAGRKPDHVFERKVTGSFRQLPLLPGWAITIHRSQGMSLDRVHVDTRGVFEAGQTYVALSRATNLAGVSLAAPIEPEMIFTDHRVCAFHQNGLRSQVREVTDVEP